MRVTNERLARGEIITMGDCADVVADLRDSRALCDKLAEALRASWDMSMAVRTSNLSDEVRAALAAYDSERGKR